jgi:methylenetetrahydrofolate reductase (NADPH)
VMRGLRSAPPSAVAPIAGFHLFPFGGLRKTGAWLRAYGGTEVLQNQS